MFVTIDDEWKSEFQRRLLFTNGANFSNVKVPCAADYFILNKLIESGQNWLPLVDRPPLDWYAVNPLISTYGNRVNKGGANGVYNLSDAPFLKHLILKIFKREEGNCKICRRDISEYTKDLNAAVNNIAIYKRWKKEVDREQRRALKEDVFKASDNKIIFLHYLIVDNQRLQKKYPHSFYQSKRIEGLWVPIVALGTCTIQWVDEPLRTLYDPLGKYSRNALYSLMTQLRLVCNECLFKHTEESMLKHSTKQRLKGL